MSTSPQLTIVVPPPIPGSEVSCTRYLARQPILDREQNTHAYELLFRSGPQNFFSACDPDAATASVIDSSLHFGSRQLTGGHLAFINCTRNILLLDWIAALPADLAIVELLQDVLADAETLAACDRLRRAGYRDTGTGVPARAITLLPSAELSELGAAYTGPVRSAGNRRLKWPYLPGERRVGGSLPGIAAGFSRPSKSTSGLLG